MPDCTASIIFDFESSKRFCKVGVHLNLDCFWTNCLKGAILSDKV